MTRPTSPTTLRSTAADWNACRRAILARITCVSVCELAGLVSSHDRWPCPNPAHKGQDRGPDLTFNRDSTGWRCHACNAGGSAFDLAVHVGAARDIADAIKVLGALAGVELPQTKWQPRTPTRPNLDQNQNGGNSEMDLESAAAAIPADRAAEIRCRFATVTQNHFTPSCSGAEYLESRSIPFEAAKSAGCGWVADPEAADRVLREKYSLAELRAAGLIGRRGGFLGYRHRLIIADRLTDGSVLALRSIAGDAKPKEFAAGRGVFGAGGSEIARWRLAQHSLWIWCEGTTDWLTALALGFAAIGVPGAGQWKYAIEAIRQMMAVAPSLVSDPLLQRHVIFFDADTAGQTGARQFEAALCAELPTSHAIRIAVPPGDGAKDLNDCVRLGATAEDLRAGFAALFE